MFFTHYVLRFPKQFPMRLELISTLKVKVPRFRKPLFFSVALRIYQVLHL